MADTEPQFSDAKRTLDYDPLSKLHKMSTTAGLGSGDYVAINILAVAAALLGVASAVASLNLVLLVIPLASAICGAIALWQISHSNGTQTGRGVAIIGLILSLGLGGFVVAQNTTKYLSIQAEQTQIAALIHDLGEKIKAREFEKAYALFDDQFKSHVPLEKFKSRWVFLDSPQMKDLYGTFKSMEWNGRLQLERDSKTSEPMASGVAFMHVEKLTEPPRQTMYFRKSGADWKISAMPDLFPPPEQAGQSE